MTVYLDSYPPRFPNWIGLANQASGCRFGKEDMHSVLYVPVRNSATQFLTLQ